MNLCIQFIIPFNNPPIAVSEETELEDCKGGFPHSEITGSKGASASPVLIAACHVLHRLSTPRHPSEALQRLIVSQQNSCLVYSARLERCRGTKPDFCQTMSSSRTRPKSSGEPVTFFLYDINARRLMEPTAILDAICELLGRTASNAGPQVMSRAAGAAWWSQTESNRRHPACKAGALPTELWPHSNRNSAKPRRAVGDAVLRLRTPSEPEVLVGPGRLELPTLRLSGVRSNHLSYGPMAATAGHKTQARDRVTNTTTRMADASMTKVERETETAAFRRLCSAL